MGGDGLDERVFATVEIVVDHGGDAWWLSLILSVIPMNGQIVLREPLPRQ